MPLSSASSLDEVNAAYDDNCDYDLQSDLDKCKTFIQACRMLQQRLPSRLQHGGQGADGFERDPLMLQKAESDALAWLRANDATMADAAGGGGVVYPDFSNW